MSLTAAQLEEHITHATGGTTISQVSSFANRTMNQACRFLTGAHQWNWRMVPPVGIDFSVITVTNGTYDDTGGAADYLITSTNSFTGYTFAVGDEFTISDGAGVAAGGYEVAQKVDASNIALSRSAGSDSTSDVDGVLRFSQLALPSDYGETVAIALDDELWDRVRWTTPEQIAHMRQYHVNPMADYYIAVVRPNDVSGGSLAKPKLVIWPPPDENITDAIELWYRRDWVDISTSTVAPIPDYMEIVTVMFVRETALGLLNGDLSDRYERLLRSKMFMDAKTRDGMDQANLGPSVGGFVQRLRPTGRVNFNPVGPPTGP